MMLEMIKNKFSVGYNYSFDGFCALVDKYKDYIESIYFPLPKEYLGSGRGSKEKDAYETELFELIKLCNDLNIKPLLLLNPNILDYSKIPKIISYFNELRSRNQIDHIVLKDPFLLKAVITEHPDVNIEISILAHVNTLKKAQYYKNLGASSIVIDRDNIRNLTLIKRINEIISVKVLLNEGCMKNGIFCDAHYNVLSEEINYKYALLSSIYEEMMRAPCLSCADIGPEKIFSAPFVRPEDLKNYVGIAKSFKLSTRNGSTRIIDNILHAYTNQSYVGNLLDLLNSPFSKLVDFIDNKALDDVEYFHKLSTCADKCEGCNFCDLLLTKTNSIDKVIAELNALIEKEPDERLYVFRRDSLERLQRGN